MGDLWDLALSYVELKEEILNFSGDPQSETLRKKYALLHFMEDEIKYYGKIDSNTLSEFITKDLWEYFLKIKTKK